MEVDEKYDLHLPPEWAGSAVWYQILVERFRNGNQNVNPTKSSIQGGTVDSVPDSWDISGWSQNWYNPDSWMGDMPVDFYRAVQLRRFGGDLAGVLEKLPYLVHLGINAIYFNPLNQSPSLHKYDSSCYHHIDPYFGPDPEKDLLMIASENPADAETWQWTSADLLFLDLVRKCDEHHIRLIVDFSWNHTGHTFWAFEDIKTQKEKSSYIDWYENIVFSKKNKESHFAYKSWNDITTLPELKKIKVYKDDKGLLRGDLPTALKSHIFSVCQRWIRPIVNGDLKKGIDGMRLDVADLIPVDFWKEMKHFCRSLHKEFFLIGEIWWESWPEKLKDTKPYLRGDIFDSIMHYHWFKAARKYFGESLDHFELAEFIGHMQEIYSGLKVEHCRALMNVTASHDSPRLLTSMYNNNLYKHNCKPNEDSEYKTELPDRKTYHLTALLLIHQFTFLGSPQIWNGDEMGMVGADDPDNRKPLIWPDFTYDYETQSAYSNYTYKIRPLFDANIHKLFRDLIRLRNTYQSLQIGDCLFYTEELADHPVLVYKRTCSTESVLVVINRSSKAVSMPSMAMSDDFNVMYRYNVVDDTSIMLPPYAALVKIKRS